MKKMPVDEVWQYLPDEAQWLAMDKNGEPAWHIDEPKMFDDGWYNDREAATIGISIDFGTDDWTQTLRQRPVKIEPGMFGKVWDGDGEPESNRARFGYLNEIDERDQIYPYHVGDTWFRHFRPCLPKERIEI